MDVRGSLDGNGRITGYQFTTKCFSGRAETLAHYLTGAKPAKLAVLAQGDRNAVPPYSGIPTFRSACSIWCHRCDRRACAAWRACPTASRMNASSTSWRSRPVSIR